MYSYQHHLQQKFEPFFVLRTNILHASNHIFLTHDV
jgi:hypothetical protein